MAGLERVKVVVRYANGDVVKGFTLDFFPNKEHFHIFPLDHPSKSSVEVCVKDLKAVFVVRDFEGDPRYREDKRFVGAEPASGKQVEVAFNDGEVMVGTTLGYDRNRQGFFIFPADPKSNNIRVFVVCSAIRNVRQL